MKRSRNFRLGSCDANRVWTHSTSVLPGLFNQSVKSSFVADVPGTYVLCPAVNNRIYGESAGVSPRSIFTRPAIDSSDPIRDAS